MEKNNILKDVSDSDKKFLKDNFTFEEDSEFLSRNYWLDFYSSILNCIMEGEELKFSKECLERFKTQFDYIAETITDDEEEEYYIRDNLSYLEGVDDEYFDDEDTEEYPFDEDFEERMLLANLDKLDN